jgi:hypothetical protein
MQQGKNHTPAQIVRILRDAEAAQAAGRRVSQICREVGISDKSSYLSCARIPATDIAASERFFAGKASP